VILRKNIVLLICCLIHFTQVSAQTAVAIFQSKSDTFQLSVNHIKQHQNYTNNIKIDQLKGNMPYNVKINFKDDSVFVQKNIFLIDDGMAHIYNITRDTIQLKKIVPAATYSKPENQLAFHYIINAEMPVDTTLKDTTTKDTTYVVPFATYYKLEDYEGRIGCPFPIKPEQQGELRSLIINENLEESKLEKVKTAILDMDSACVLVDQIKELIVLFEFEETRLDFAKFILDYTFDIDNYEKLYSVFNFENSKDELKTAISDK
jgi:Domain of unknown function (DUF4476)